MFKRRAQHDVGRYRRGLRGLGRRMLRVALRPYAWATQAAIQREVSARPLGISALVRVKDEALWVEASLTSLWALADEIVVVDASTDGSWDAIQRFARKHETQDKLRLLRISASGSERFRRDWESPLNTGCHVAQSNLGLRSCSYRLVFRWDADFVGSDDIAHLRERLLRIGEHVSGGWSLTLPVVNVSGDLDHVCARHPLGWEPRVHVNWGGLRYRQTPDGRFETLNIPLWFRMLAIRDRCYVYHMSTLKSELRVFLRAVWTSWREECFRHPAVTPGSLREYALRFGERHLGLRDPSLEDCAREWTRRCLVRDLRPYDARRLGPLPRGCEPGRRFRILYDAAGSPVDRVEVGPSAHPDASARDGVG